MVQLYSWLNFTFKELSNDTSHAQIQVKTKKLWPRQVGQRKLSQQRKLYHDKVFLSHRETLSQQRKLCHNKVFLSHRANSVAIEKTCRNKVFLLEQRNSVAIEKTL